MADKEIDRILKESEERAKESNRRFDKAVKEIMQIL